MWYLISKSELKRLSQKTVKTTLLSKYLPESTNHLFKPKIHYQPKRQSIKLCWNPFTHTDDPSKVEIPNPGQTDVMHDQHHLDPGRTSARGQQRRCYPPEMKGWPDRQNTLCPPAVRESSLRPLPTDVC